MLLWPTNAALARALVDDRRRAAALCGAVLHRDFPDDDLSRMLPAYAASIEAADASATDAGVTGGSVTGAGVTGAGVTGGSTRGAGWGLWLVIFKRDRLVVGGVGFKGAPTPRGEVAIGYGIVRAHRRRGLAAEATTALVRWAFVDARVSRVVAECATDNAASFGVLRRVGFARLPDVSAAQSIRWELQRADWRQGRSY